MDNQRSILSNLRGKTPQSQLQKQEKVPDSNWVIQSLRMFTNLVLKCTDGIFSNSVRLQLYIYWFVADRYPLFLRIYEDRSESLRTEINEKTLRVQHLESEKNALIQEVENTRKRLSEVVSVRLRDNNPNIVDLNDQCRPTKLGEMFSELYDNEWTNAFGVLEGPLGEKSAIVTLLDIVMEAYGICEETVAVPWNILTAWFLDKNLPGAQQTTKWLKDSRKANIRRQIPKVTNDFEKKISEIFRENKVKELLEGNEVKRYIEKVIELCLLMVTTDPPVVIVCPGWKPAQLTHEDDATWQKESAYQTLMEQEDDNNQTEKDKDEEKVLQDTADEKENGEERHAFNKDLFKDYTKRGDYLDFVVWPILFLHKDGPTLSKGIAQGCKELYK